MGGGSAAAGVMQGLGGAVRARGLIGGSASGLGRRWVFTFWEARIDPCSWRCGGGSEGIDVETSAEDSRRIE